jgi:cytidylate kinase
VVAIDGPAGSGKSTVARRLAVALGARYLDTGAMYRAVTLAVLQAGIDPDDPAAVVKVAGAVHLVSGTNPKDPHIRLDGIDVDRAIRGPDVTAAVSAVSAVPEVRRLLVAAQREIIADATRIVVEGRDIGTVVAPDAALKVYLTADVAERARRRSTQQHGVDGEAEDQLAATADDLTRRDGLDSSRTVDPLARADDAVVLDSTALGIDEVVVRLLRLLGETSSVLDARPAALPAADRPLSGRTGPGDGAGG